MLKVVGFALGAALACVGTAHAQTVAVGANVGTPGLGLQVAVQVNKTVVLRGAVDGLELSRNEDYGDISYDGKAKLFTGGAFVDLHPGGGPFFVSGGAYVGKRRLDLSATPTSAVEIGDVTYTPAQVGRINGEAKLSTVEPFVGLGLDNTFSGDRAWGFRALVGVAFSKEPDVALSASGGALSADPAFLTQLREEEREAREDAKSVRYFPVIQVGVTHRF